MVLITGATGLVGSHLMAHLILARKNMRCLKRESSSLAQVEYVLHYYNITREDYLFYVSWVEGDLGDERALLAAMQDITVLYHCAADVGLGGVDAEQMRRVNVEGTERIVRAAKVAGVSTLCYISSIAAIGKEAHGTLVSEKSGWDSGMAHAPYAQSKYDAERFVMAADGDGFNVVVVNPGPILGVSCNDTGSAKIIYLAKRGIPFSTNGGTGYVDVRDVCRAMVQLVEQKIYGERFILVGFNASNHELLTALMRAFGKCSPFALPKWAVMAAATIMEYGAKLLGTRTPLDRGFARTALSRTWYNNSKIRVALSFEFRSMEETVNDIANTMKNKK